MDPETLNAIIDMLEKAAPIAAGVVAIVGTLENLLEKGDLTDEQRARIQAMSDELHSRFQATP